MKRSFKVHYLMAIGLGALILAAMPAMGGQSRGSKATGSGPSNPEPTNPASPDYVIHPQDVLDVTVWKQPDLSFRGLPVRPDGKISLPLVNDVQAAGFTAMQLSASITQKLK